MYEWAGFRGKDRLKSIFIFSDNDVVMESFLEDLQNMLNGGVVPNLYSSDDLSKLREDLRKPFKRDGGTIETPDALNEYFFNKVKDNLHLSICMSPLGKGFKDYCRMYPALINNTTIDWFMKWPEDALSEVAQRFIGKMNLGKQLSDSLAKLCAYAHQNTTDSAEIMKDTMKRIFYVTPTNYIELLKGYSQIITVKRTEVDS